ncbi:2,5-diketo-D-gluconic acid reductase [Vagococcus penaei]|uniref:2,5-diketo-D-gluconic acid reductase n=1 Tax=Vagococcus penaei TaxID=633807 RepID=A0A1Q2D484_9ENTE|nr:aldo/keto reductase [Vagococcus penaei]AQP53196.1 2,5-diketo-D-gluconic acid reductase [Vagococcus penaei]RSU00998.1 2,5-diketo-D-gluconic acid reductase [Vagococcus penaei]
MLTATSTFKLNDGHEIPVIGFGTWQTPSGQVAKESVMAALADGYRHIDTAAIYGNEESVGEGIKDSGVPREEIFLTTKLWNSEHTYDKASAAIDESLKKLGTDYLDLYLIHWPNPLAYRDDWEKANSEAWRAMEDAVKAGKIKSIGVSNFKPHHIDALMKTATIKPVINQIFLNPSDLQPEVVDYATKHDILLEAYSPLGTGKIFELDELKTIAARYNKSVAQVVLRWGLHHNFLPLPKSVTPSRIKENLDIFDFSLSDDDIKLIDGLSGKFGKAPDPDKVDY